MKPGGEKHKLRRAIGERTAKAKLMRIRRGKRDQTGVEGIPVRGSGGHSCEREWSVFM